MALSLGKSSSASVYSLFFFRLSCSGAVRALDFISWGGGRLTFRFLLLLLPPPPPGLLTREPEETIPFFGPDDDDDEVLPFDEEPLFGAIFSDKTRTNI